MVGVQRNGSDRHRISQLRMLCCFRPSPLALPATEAPPSELIDSKEASDEVAKKGVATEQANVVIEVLTEDAIDKVLVDLLLPRCCSPRSVQQDEEPVPDAAPTAQSVSEDIAPPQQQAPSALERPSLPLISEEQSQLPLSEDQPVAAVSVEPLSDGSPTPPPTPQEQTTPGNTTGGSISASRTKSRLPLPPVTPDSASSPPAPRLGTASPKTTTLAHQ